MKTKQKHEFQCKKCGYWMDAPASHKGGCPTSIREANGVSGFEDAELLRQRAEAFDKLRTLNDSMTVLAQRGVALQQELARRWAKKK